MRERRFTGMWGETAAADQAGERNRLMRRTERPLRD